MNKALISLMFVLLFFVGACGDDDKGNTGNTGDSGNTGATCTGSDKFCHSHDGLNWSDASSDYMTWDEAITYCENLGGRLPTISELRTLIQNCQGTETGGECGVTDSCLSSEDCWNDPCYGCEYDESGKYSVFGDTYWFWSSSEQSDYAGYAWGVYFGLGSVSDGYKHHSVSVRCLR
jgi:hypothetical protein